MSVDFLDTGQLGLGDMDPEAFRRHGHAVVDWIADYLADPTRWPVFPRVAPGSVRAALPAFPPSRPEPMEEVLADFERLIVPATTHWNHPASWPTSRSPAPGRGSWARCSPPRST